MSWEVLVAAPSTLLLIRKNPPSINFTIYTHKMDTIHLGESDVSSFFMVFGHQSRTMPTFFTAGRAQVH